MNKDFAPHRSFCVHQSGRRDSLSGLKILKIKDKHSEYLMFILGKMEQKNNCRSGYIFLGMRLHLREVFRGIWSIVFFENKKTINF